MLICENCHKLLIIEPEDGEVNENEICSCEEPDYKVCQHNDIQGH